MKQAYKHIVIVGVDHAEVIDPIRKAWNDKGLREGIDYVIVGKGEDEGAPQEEIDEAFKYTSEATHTHYIMHGRTSGTTHENTLTGYDEPTIKMLQRYSGIPGTQHVWSCLCGAVQKSIMKYLPYMPIILHSGSKYDSLKNMNAEAVAAFGVFCVDFESTNRRAPNTKEAMAWCIYASPETHLYPALPIEKDKAFKICAPKKPVGENDIVIYCDDQCTQFYDKLKEKGVKEDEFLPVQEFLPKNNAIRYLELTIVIEAKREHSKHGATYIMQYLDLGVNPNAALINGLTAFHAACSSANKKVVRAMLTYPDVDINLPDEDGVTPLCNACSKRHIEILKLLLAAPDIKINTIDYEGETPLYVASQKGFAPIVQLLVAHPDILINQQKLNGATPLYTACQMGRTDVVKILLEHGADIHKGLHDAFTPLMVAALAGKDEVVEILLKHPGADLKYLQQTCNNKNIPEEYHESLGKDAIQMAKDSGYTTIVNMIESRMKELTVQKYSGKGKEKEGSMGLG